jgi:ABC-type polysaccharide/polyol phosphate transport system ATPase subunit
MNSTAILLKNVTKRYYLEKPRTLKRWFSSLFSPYGRFTVIKNFSSIVNKGEFVLVTGPNGCGKTTLLKLIAGITLPDAGSIKTYGKVVPLIELGAGFNYELTGMENILINATILGIDKKIIKTKTRDIVEFSGLKSFVDVPLKRYSSGMVSRLAFSIAISSEPEILLLDEIFAVGDEEFKERSFSKLSEFHNNRVTILLTTHFEKFIRIKPDRIINLQKTNYHNILRD